MGRMKMVAVATCLGVFASGCGLVDGLMSRFRPEEPDEDQPVVILDTAPNGEVETFEESMVPGLPSAAQLASAELISSTNPDERRREIAGSRSDPFALVPIPPPPAPPETPTAPGAAPGTAPGTAPGAGRGTPATQRPTATRPGTTPPRQQTRPGSILPPLSPLPTLPQPDSALGVVITGVVQVNGNSYAIVDAPGEPTSRYVRVGDRLSGGRVLVKRIETQGGEPFVILEENGIEVARIVGDTSGGGFFDSSPSLSFAPGNVDIAVDFF